MMMSHNRLGLVVMTSYSVVRYVRHHRQKHTATHTHAPLRIMHQHIDGPNVRTNVTITSMVVLSYGHGQRNPRVLQHFLRHSAAGLGIIFQITKLTFSLWADWYVLFLWWMKIQTWNNVTCQVVGVLSTHPNEQIRKATVVPYSAVDSTNIGSALVNVDASRISHTLME
jgi:hypothetical protein